MAYNYTGAHMNSRDVGFAHTQGPGETKLHQGGMKKTMPNATDASTRCSGPSVNSGATRESTAKTPGTLGGRVA